MLGRKWLNCGNNSSNLLGESTQEMEMLRQLLSNQIKLNRIGRYFPQKYTN